MAAKLTRLTHI